jgi:hypothetical protein
MRDARHHKLPAYHGAPVGTAAGSRGDEEAADLAALDFGPALHFAVSPSHVNLTKKSPSIYDKT